MANTLSLIEVISRYGTIVAPKKMLTSLGEFLDFAGDKFSYDIEWIDDEERKEEYRNNARMCHEISFDIFRSIEEAEENTSFDTDHAVEWTQMHPYGYYEDEDNYGVE